jgi:hypothetical protein
VTEQPTAIFTDGGVSLFTGEPFVSVRVGKECWQWTCTEAREFALLLLRTADFAQDDADIVTELREMKLPDEALGRFLQAIRERRARRD